MSIHELKVLIQEKKIIPFVGAGVSLAVTSKDTSESLFPSWKQLLLNSADKIKESNPNVATAINSLLAIEEPDYLYIAGMARSNLTDWYKFLKSQFDRSKNEAQEQSLALAKEIWALGSPFLITTNYDKVLRWACYNQGDVREWDIEAAFEQGEALRNGCHHPTIWHVHGHIDNVTNIILTAGDYEKLYPVVGEGKVTFEAAFASLRTLLSTKSFVFIGYSLDDVKFVAELDKVAKIFKGGAGPHFALIREKDIARVEALNLPIKIIPFTDFGPPLLTLLQQLGGKTDEEQEPSVIENFAPKNIFIESEVIVGNVKAREDLKLAISRWAKGSRGNGGIIVIGEEGTGKSLLIGESCQKSSPGIQVIKLSGRSYLKAPDRFLFHALGSIFGVDPTFDGKIIAALELFCRENQLLSARRLVKFLQICQGELENNLHDATLLTSITDSVSTYSTCAGTDSQGTDFSHARATFCPYTELWRVIKVHGRISGRPIILWLEDAQLFYHNTPDIIISLFQNASEGDESLLLIGEFRAERTRDTTIYRETFERYTKYKPIFVKDLPKDEVAELIAHVLNVSKKVVPKDLTNDILKASGGNPKFTVDYVKFLKEQGIISKEASDTFDEEIIYNKQIKQSIPKELKTICKERILHYRPSKSESWVLSLMAVLDLQEVSVRLLKNVIDDADVAVNRLIEELGILKYCDSSLDVWKVRFEHLTARESCLELLEESPRADLDELLKKLQQALLKRGSDRPGPDATPLRTMLKEVSLYAENMEVLSSLILNEVLNCTRNDLPYLKKLARMYAKELSGNELILAIKYVILMKINDLEHREGKPLPQFDSILKLEDFLKDFSDHYFHKAVISTLAYTLASMSATDLQKSTEILAATIVNISKSAPSTDLMLGSATYLFQSYLSKCDYREVKKKDVFEALLPAFEGGPLLITDFKILFWNICLDYLSEDNTIYINKFIAPVVSISEAKLKESAESANHEMIQFYSYAGTGMIIGLLHKLCHTRSALLAELLEWYDKLERFVELADSMLAAHGAPKIQSLDGVRSEVARAVATRGDLETGAAIVRKAYNCTNSESVDNVLALSELLTLEYTCVGPNGVLAEELHRALDVCSDYSRFSPKGMDTLISALLIASPIKTIDYNEVINKWLTALSATEPDLIEIINFLDELRKYCPYDVKSTFVAIRANFKLSHSIKLFLGIIEHLVFSDLEVDADPSHRDEIYIRHIKRLQGLYEGNDFSDIKDINLSYFIVYSIAEMIGKLSSSQRDAVHFFKYGKRHLERQFSVSEEKPISYWRRRWLIMYKLNEVAEVISECNTLLEDDGFDKGFIYGWLSYVHRPKESKGAKKKESYLNAFKYACLYNDHDPSNPDSFLKLTGLLQLDSTLACEDLTSRYERCLLRQLEEHEYKAAFTITQDLILFCFGENRVDDALALIDDAVQYSMRIVPPELSAMLSIKNAELFILMSRNINDVNLARSCFVAYKTLVSEFDSLSNFTRRSVTGTEVLIKYNYACAALLSGNFDCVESILNEILKDDRFRNELPDLVKYLIVCHFDSTVFGKSATDIPLELAVVETKLAYYRAKGLSYKCGTIIEQIEKLRSKYSYSGKKETGETGSRL